MPFINRVEKLCPFLAPLVDLPHVDTIWEPVQSAKASVMPSLTKKTITDYLIEVF